MALKKAMTGPTEETPGTTFDFYWFILWIYIWTSWSATFLTVSEDQPPITINVPPGIGLGRVTGGQTARGLRGIGGGIWRSCEMRFGPSYAIVSRISGKALASENVECIASGYASCIASGYLIVIVVTITIIIITITIIIIILILILTLIIIPPTKP